MNRTLILVAPPRRTPLTLLEILGAAALGFVALGAFVGNRRPPRDPNQACVPAGCAPPSAGCDPPRPVNPNWDPAWGDDPTGHDLD